MKTQLIIDPIPPVVLLSLLSFAAAVVKQELALGVETALFERVLCSLPRFFSRCVFSCPCFLLFV
jgi:hypothetical protein